MVLLTLDVSTDCKSSLSLFLSPPICQFHFLKTMEANLSRRDRLPVSFKKKKKRKSLKILTLTQIGYKENFSSFVCLLLIMCSFSFLDNGNKRSFYLYWSCLCYSVFLDVGKLLKYFWFIKWENLTVIFVLLAVIWLRKKKNCLLRSTLWTIYPYIVL